MMEDNLMVSTQIAKKLLYRYVLKMDELKIYRCAAYHQH